jgi:tRNA(Ile)-lysidine synthase
MLDTNIVEKFFKRQAENIVALATSGGGDSMAMALLFSKWAKLNGTKIIALIVDHKLRPESSAEALAVQSNLATLGIDSKILVWQHDKVSSNIQARARAARYKLLAEYCHQHNIKTLAVAHNKNDQAETVLLRIFRGSGIKGVAGIKSVVKLKGVRVIRPLLAVSKEEIIAYLQANSVTWVEDPSNKNEKFARIKVRNYLASQPAIVTSRLCLLAKNARRAQNFIEQEVKQKLSQIMLAEDSLNLEQFKSLHEEIALRILAKMLRHNGNTKRVPRLESLELLYNNIIRAKPQNKTLGGCFVKVKKNVISFEGEEG